VTGASSNHRLSHPRAAPLKRPTTPRICCWSTTTAASATCVSRFLSGEAIRHHGASAVDARAKLLGFHLIC